MDDHLARILENVRESIRNGANQLVDELEEKPSPQSLTDPASEKDPP